jgi:glycosyltransferase involved in cell wall biosynthesis
MKGILVMLHRGSNYGYAIAPLETTFYNMALNLLVNEENIHFSYTNLDNGFPRSLPEHFKNVIAFDTSINSRQSFDFIHDYVRKSSIDTAFGFDQGVARPAYKVLRQAGIRSFISYWGAPMGSLNRFPKLQLKRLEVALRRHKPDHYIFESRAMAETAEYGRGISPARISVVPLGVDTEKFKPATAPSSYAHEVIGIPNHKKIVFYSGHMEERKGIRVLLQAARRLTTNNGRTDVHFLLIGNKDGEERKFEELIRGTEAEKHITFGGYRADVQQLLQSCSIGLVPSSGWDSFPRSSLEMLASGLPLIASRLQGLMEQVEEGVTGLFFEPGDHCGCADAVARLLEDERLRISMSRTARQQAVQKFSLHRQVLELSRVVSGVADGK